MTDKEKIFEELKKILMDEVPPGVMYREITCRKQAIKVLERFKLTKIKKKGS